MRVILAYLLVLAACFTFEADATFAYRQNAYSSRSRKSSYGVSSRSKSSGSYSKSSGSHSKSSGGSNIYKTVQNLQWQLKQVSKRGCITGNVKLVICDPEHYDVSHCTYRYLYEGYEKVVDIPVKFDDYHGAEKFDYVPVVTAGLSGLNSDVGKNCDVEATYPTKKGFTLHITLGGVLPFDLKLFWMACDARIYH